MLFINGIESGDGKWQQPKILYHKCGALQIAFQCIFVQMARLAPTGSTEYVPWSSTKRTGLEGSCEDLLGMDKEDKDEDAEFVDVYGEIFREQALSSQGEPNQFFKTSKR